MHSPGCLTRPYFAQVILGCVLLDILVSVWDALVQAARRTQVGFGGSDEHYLLVSVTKVVTILTMAHM